MSVLEASTRNKNKKKKRRELRSSFITRFSSKFERIKDIKDKRVATGENNKLNTFQLKQASARNIEHKSVERGCS